MNSVPYDIFVNTFLQKVREHDLMSMLDYEKNEIVDGYMKRALAEFKPDCLYDFSTTGDDIVRAFHVEVDDGDIVELADIVSEGMLAQWLKPFVYKQENLENLIGTRDYSTYSPSELLKRVGEAYKNAQKDFTKMRYDYSYSHGDLTVLHL